MSFLHRFNVFLRSVEIGHLAWTAASLLPLVILARLLHSHLIHAPFMDDFVWLPLYEKMASGQFHWSDFFFVQMEHRLTVPCFIAWLVYHYKPGQIEVHCWVSFFQIALQMWNLAFILARTSRLPRSTRWALVALSGWICCSPAQYTTLLWGDCMSSFMPLVFLTSAMALFFSRLGPLLKFAGSAICAVLATHSFASGVLVWVLMPPLFWGSPIQGLDARHRVRFLVGWGLAFIFTMALYFHNLVNQAEPAFSYEQGKEETLSKHVGAVLHDPFAAVRFVLLFCGSLLGRGSFSDIQPAALAVGVLLCLITLFGACFAWRKRKVAEALEAWLPWLMISLYTLGTGAMVAFGRLWASPNLNGALWGRYTTHAVPISYASVVMLALGMREWKKKGDELPSQVQTAALLLLGVMVTMTGYSWLYGLRQLDAWKSSRLRDAASMQFCNVIENSNLQGPSTGNIALAQRWNALGLIKPAMATSSRLYDLHRTHPLSSKSAELSNLSVADHQSIKLSGVAMLDSHERVADAVLLTYKDSNGESTLFGLAHVLGQPYFLSRILDVDSQYLHPQSRHFWGNYGTFSGEFRFPHLPSGEYEITAWGFDYLKQSIGELSGKFIAQVDEQGLKSVLRKSDAQNKTP